VYDLELTIKVNEADSRDVSRRLEGHFWQCSDCEAYILTNDGDSEICDECLENIPDAE